MGFNNSHPLKLCFLQRIHSNKNIVNLFLNKFTRESSSPSKTTQSLKIIKTHMSSTDRPSSATTIPLGKKKKSSIIPFSVAPFGSPGDKQLRSSPAAVDFTTSNRPASAGLTTTARRSRKSSTTSVTIIDDNNTFLNTSTCSSSSLPSAIDEQQQNDEISKGRNDLQHFGIMTPSPMKKRFSTITTTSSSASASNRKRRQSTFEKQQKLLTFLESMIEDSNSKALKLSLKAAGNNSSQQQQLHYEKAKKEAAASAVAVLEGLEDLFSITSVDLSMMTTFADSSENPSKTTSLSTIIKKALVAIKNVVFDINNNAADYVTSSTPTTTTFQHIEDMTIERVKNYHRSLFSTLQDFVSKQRKEGTFDDDDDDDDKERAKSPSKLAPLREQDLEMQRRQKQELDNFQILSPMQSQNLKKLPMSLRILNCDRMLERMRTMKRFSTRQNNNPNSSLVSNNNNFSSSSSSPSAVWADAEDALHVLRLRFVFHLWKALSRCERQRRINSYRAVQKMRKERAHILMLRTFLAFKRSQLVTKSLATKNLLKENKELGYKIESYEEACKKAGDRTEQANILYRNTLAELQKLKEEVSERERCPMIFDLRYPLASVVSTEQSNTTTASEDAEDTKKIENDSKNRNHEERTAAADEEQKPFHKISSLASRLSSSSSSFIESGVIEFQKVVGDQFANSKSLLSRSDMSMINSKDNNNSLLHQIYPPFVDFCCPRQGNHARELIEHDFVDRMSNEKGIACPGYRAPQSYYEIRIIPNHQMADLLMKNNQNNSNNKDSNNNHHHATTAASPAKTAFNLKQQSSEKNKLQQAPNNNILAEDYFASSFSIQRWDLEFVSMINGVLQKYSQISLKNEDGNNKNDYNDDNVVASSSSGWDIDEPFSQQMVQRDVFGVVIPSAILEELEEDRRGSNNNKSTSPTTTQQQQKSPGKKRKNNTNPKSPQKSNKEESGNNNTASLMTASPSNSIFGSVLFSSSSAVFSASASSAIYQRRKSNAVGTTTSAFHSANTIQLIQQTITRAQETFASVHQQFFEAGEKFVNLSTEQHLDEARRKEMQKAREQNDITSQIALEKPFAAVGGGSGVSGFLSKAAIASVAPPLLTPMMILRNKNLHVDSPGDLLTHPEIAVRLLIVVFGRTAVLQCLTDDENNVKRLYLVSSSSFAHQCSVVASILVEQLLLKSNTSCDNVKDVQNSSEVEEATANNGDEEGTTEDEQKNQQPGIISSVSSPTSKCCFFSNTVLSSSHEYQSRLGRELCLLIQSHLAQTMIDAEHDIRQIGANALMMRRIQSGALSRKRS